MIKCKWTKFGVNRNSVSLFVATYDAASVAHTLLPMRTGAFTIFYTWHRCQCHRLSQRMLYVWLNVHVAQHLLYMCYLFVYQIVPLVTNSVNINIVCIQCHSLIRVYLFSKRRPIYYHLWRYKIHGNDRLVIYWREYRIKVALRNVSNPIRLRDVTLRYLTFHGGDAIAAFV